MLIATVIFCVLGGAAYFATRAPPEQPRGMLALHIQPPTAVLRLDGNQVGSAADFRQEIAAGAHELEISAEGYQSRHEAVTVPAGGEKSVEFALVMVPPPPTTGILALRVSPPAAVLKLDGKPVGTAADFRQEIAAGAHELEISAEGYQSRHEAVTVPVSGEKSVELALVMVPPPPTTGILELYISPSGAALTLDDARIGSANGFRRELPAGPHKIEITAPRYLAINQTLTIKAGEVNSVRFELAIKPTPQKATGRPRPTNEPSWVPPQVQRTNPAPPAPPPSFSPPRSSPVPAAPRPALPPP